MWSNSDQEVLSGEGAGWTGVHFPIGMSPKYYHQDDPEAGQDARGGETDDKCPVTSVRYRAMAMVETTK